MCENSQHIVVGADRMFTAGPPLNVEFEPPVSKIEKIGTSCLALASGQTVYATEVVARTRNGLDSNQSLKVLSVTLAMKEIYSAFRDEKIEEQVIRPSLGPDFVSFRSRGGTIPQYLQPQPGIYQQVFIQSQQFNLGLDLMIVGIDETGSHIYFLGHPGTLVNLDKLGYNSIGSGGVHAAVRFYLGGQSPKSSLLETLFSVYAAKRASEVAPGVGRETELAIISKDKVWMCSEPLMKTLEEIHREMGTQAKPNLEKVKKSYESERQAD